MTISKVDWLNRIVYSGFGILVGAAIQWGWGSQEEKPAEKTIVFDRAFDAVSDEKSTFEFKKVIAQAVREEIIAQFAAAKVDPQSNCSSVVAINKADKERAAIEEKRVEGAYSLADHSLDEVISSGGLDPLSAKEYVANASSLPSEKVIELSMKYFRAMNEGLLRTNMLPEEIATMK